MFGLHQPLVDGGEPALDGLFSKSPTLSQLCHSKQASKFREFGNALLDYSVLLTLVNRRNDMNDNTVLSASVRSELLAHREAPLRSCGYDVFSSTSEIQVRFKTEMGRCDVLLLCYTILQNNHADLAGLFMRRCPAGVVAFVMHPSRREKSRYAHICLLDSDFPHRLHLIKGAAGSETPVRLVG